MFGKYKKNINKPMKCMQAPFKHYMYIMGLPLSKQGPLGSYATDSNSIKLLHTRLISL